MKTYTFVRGLTAAFLVTTLCLGLTARAQTPAPVSNASNGDTGGQVGTISTEPFIVRRAAAKASVVQTPHARVETFISTLPNTSHPTYQGVAAQIRDWLLAGAPDAGKPSVVTDKLTVQGILAANNSDSGSRTHFPLLITSHQKFSLSGVSWTMTSSDSANSLGYVSGLNGLNYDPITRVGVDYGADNMVGGVGNNADTTRSNESGSGLVNRLAYVGAGNAYRANSQADIDAATSYYNGQRPFVLTCAYRVQFLNGGQLDIVQTASSFGAATLTSVQEGSNVRLQLAVTGDTTGASFTIQTSNDLINWSNAGVSLAPGGVTTVPVSGAKFFRAYRP